MPLFFYTMTIQEYSIIINTFLDFFPDDRIDIQYSSSFPQLKKYIADYAEGKEIPENIQQNINNVGIQAVRIIVYYPSITLTNEHGNTHTITDVYVETTLPDLSIYLTRTSYTQEEVDVGYTHSHVNTYNFGKFSLFCTGSSNTVINRIKGNIFSIIGRSSDSKKSSDYVNLFTNKITSFIIEEQRILDVESLNGVPYIKMSSISDGKSEDVPIFVKPTNYIHTALNGFYGTDRIHIVDFIKYYISLQLDDFIYNGKCWQLDCSDAEFINRVTRVAKTYRYIYKKEKFFENVIIKDGLYYKKKETPNNYALNPNTDWTFKGNTLPIRVLGKKEVYHYKKILKRSIINYLYGVLLNLINSIYASEEFKDCMHSRAYKVTSYYIAKV